MEMKFRAWLKRKWNLVLSQITEIFTYPNYHFAKGLYIFHYFCTLHMKSWKSLLTFGRMQSIIAEYSSSPYLDLVVGGAHIPSSGNMCLFPGHWVPGLTLRKCFMTWKTWNFPHPPQEGLIQENSITSSCPYQLVEIWWWIYITFSYTHTA